MLNRQLSSSNKCSITKKEKQRATQRNPFQDLNNGFSRNNSSNSSSISSSVSIDAPRGCLRFFLSNPTSSKTPLLHKPISLSKTKSKIRTKTTSKSAPNAKRSSNLLSSSARSNKPSDENRLPKPKPSKMKKNLPCLYQWQSGSKSQHPISPGSVPRCKFLTNVGNSQSGSEEFGQKLKDLKWELKKLDNAGESSEHLNTYVVENCTPVAKLACGSVLDCENYDGCNTLVEQGSNSTTKTPPVQASVSPEIQCGPSMLDTTSTKTPNTCYAAGYVISGVTDKRKCRPRGILTVGVGLDASGCNMKGNVTDSDDSSEHYIRVLRNSKSSLIPLPDEASMSWHLSPCHEEDGGEKGDSANRLRSSATVDLPSSPTLFDGSASFLCNRDAYSGTTSSNATPSGSKTRITLLSPRRLSEFHGFSGHSSDKVDGQLSVVSPFATPSCKAVLSREERKLGYNLAGENSRFSICSLSSGNVMQTPKSESSSERHFYPSWLDSEGFQKEHHETEIDSLVEVLQRQSLSPKSISLWDPFGLSFRFANLSSPSNSIDLNQINNILDNHDSLISDSTLENVPQSEMRISWREGLVSRIFEMDELDCCRCLSDGENDAEGSNKDQLKAQHEFNVDVQIDRFSDDGFGSPEFLDHEPRIGVKGKSKSSPQRPTSCAESICTDGGGLVTSGDSDWTLCYKNHLFEI